MNKNTYCVYRHTSPSGKSYIGITGLKPEFRWNGGMGYSPRTIFGCAIQKYGWNNFKHEIIYNCLSERGAKEKEILLIKELRTTERQYGYNETFGGEGANGYKHTEKTLEHLREINSGENNPLYGMTASLETREKMSAAHRGKHTGGWKQSEQAKQKISEAMTGGRHPRAKSVKQYDLDGTYIAEYPTLTEAAIAVGGYNQHIAHCCKKSRKQHCGYIWRYAE